MSATATKKASPLTAKEQFLAGQYHKRLEEDRQVIAETEIARKVDRFMELMSEIADLGEEIAEEGTAGDTPWHEEYCDDLEGYHEGFLRDVQAIARVCHTMHQAIHTWGRTQI